MRPTFKQLEATIERYIKVKMVGWGSQAGGIMVTEDTATTSNLSQQPLQDSRSSSLGYPATTPHSSDRPSTYEYQDSIAFPTSRAGTSAATMATLNIPGGSTGRHSTLASDSECEDQAAAAFVGGSSMGSAARKSSAMVDHEYQYQESIPATNALLPRTSTATASSRDSLGYHKRGEHNGCVTGHYGQSVSANSRTGPPAYNDVVPFPLPPSDTAKPPSPLLQPLLEYGSTAFPESIPSARSSVSTAKTSLSLVSYVPLKGVSGVTAAASSSVAGRRSSTDSQDSQDSAGYQIPLCGIRYGWVKPMVWLLLRRSTSFPSFFFRVYFVTVFILCRLFCNSSIKNLPTCTARGCCNQAILELTIEQCCPYALAGVLSGHHNSL